VIGLLNRIKDALFGFAIGDALGATTEFLTKEEIKREYGQVNEMVGGGWLKLLS
jgi:ADP-ribosyl-[dinitrogen reductase] hydrolase